MISRRGQPYSLDSTSIFDGRTVSPMRVSVTDAQRLAIVRSVHTAIYIVMAVSTFVLLYAGITGWRSVWLWVAMAMLGVEVIVFVGSGMKCPLSALAVKYGAGTGHVLDTFLPEPVTRYTFRFFGAIMLLGLILLVARWFAVLP
jgi:hypothetical protein